MNLPKLGGADIDDKKVIVRLDLDIDPKWGNESLRLETSLNTLRYLYENASEVLVIGSRGRPEGKITEKLSLKPVIDKLSSLLGREVGFEENLRFNLGEEENNEDFTRELAKKGDFFVNESFAMSHRKHASIVGLPKLLPHAAGFRFAKEVENLSKVFQDPERPIVVILSGVKKDKLNYLDNLAEKADKVLIAGRLPEFLRENYEHEKVVVARLTPDKEDITVKSIEKFEDELANTKTILVSGPLGKFEEESHRQGTERIFKRVAESDAFKVVGGGDPAAAIETLSIADKFDWVSTGGGAMLEFLTKGTLPGIEALVK